MDRELLLEIGCEEIPASWLPGLTDQVGEKLVGALTAARLAPSAPAETFSTPRRLTARIARLPERQTDFIFAAFSEEFGLLGTISVCLVFLFLVGRGLTIALEGATLFARLLAGRRKKWQPAGCHFCFRSTA